MAPVDLVPAHLSDRDLLAEVTRLAAREREASAALVTLLAEMDARRLHLAEGCSSLFSYCTERLHLSEHAAYHRIEAARAVRAFPAILGHLRSGSLTLTAVTLLRPHLAAANHVELLECARGCSKRDVERLVRRLAPLADVRASVRKLPETRRPPAPSLAPVPCTVSSDAAHAAAPYCAERSKAASPPVMPTPAHVMTAALALDASPAEHVRDAAEGSAARQADAARLSRRPAEIRALSPARYSLRVTLSADGHAKLRRAQDLLRHTVPDGDPGAVVDRALSLLVEHLERRKCAAVKREPDPTTPRAARGRAARTPAATRAAEAGNAVAPRGCDAVAVVSDAAALAVRSASARSGRPSRHIPASVKREVWGRDEGRCAFRGVGGRCRETGRLEFHHRVPVADGGAATAHNLELRCTSHHAHESRRWFGEEAEWFDGIEREGGLGIGVEIGTRPGPS
jgi:hypothetical protein